MAVVDPAVVRRGTLVLGAGLVPYALVWQLVATVAPLTAERLTADPALAGLALAVAIVGSALAPLPAGRLMDRYGRRPGLSLGFALGALGLLVALAGVRAFSAPLFYAGLTVFGAGSGTVLLTRVAVADMYPPERRASAIGRVLAGTAAGALLGALVFTPMLRGVSDLATLDAPWLVAAGVFGAGALLVWLAPVDPLVIARRLHAAAALAPAHDGRGLAVLLRERSLRLAVLGGAVAQLTMAGSMPTMGLVLRHAGRDLGDVSVALGAHLVGMYALAPFGGALVARVGGVRALLVGLATIAVAVIGILSPSLLVVSVAMFSVGVGWSVAFVAATTLLANAVEPSRRGVVLGANDLVVVSSGAIGSATATPILAAFGVGTIVAAALALALLPVLLVAAAGARTPRGGRGVSEA